MGEITIRQPREEKQLSQGDIEKLPRYYIPRVENGHTVPPDASRRDLDHAEAAYRNLAS